MNGVFITFEGGEGSGKTTIANMIKETLTQEGYQVVLTREPGGTKISDKIREVILDKNNAEMSPMTEMLLYAASRAQHVEEVIIPAVNAGKIVICDRFVDSSIAYQGFGRNLGDSVAKINGFAVGDCMPDITFLMKLDPRVGKNRIGSREQDRLELEKEAFHVAVFEGYLELEKEYPDRIFGIDANRTIDEIKADIYKKLEEVLESVSK